MNGWMGDMSRRRLIQLGTVASGLPLAGCSGFGEDAEDSTRTPTGTPTPTPLPTMAQVDHWIWFRADESLRRRAAESFDVRDDGRRWMAAPTGDGGMRCLVENDDAPGHAGFSFGIGPIGGLQRVTIDAEPLVSDSGGQRLRVAISLDASGDGAFFDWEQADGRDTFAGQGGDLEGVRQFTAAGTITLDGDTEVNLVPSAETASVTVADLQDGVLESVDGTTEAALHVSVIGSGPNNVEEVRVDEVAVENESIYTPLPGSWPMFGQDQFNSGNNVESHGPRDSIRVDWEFGTGGAVRSSAAVVCASVFVGSDDGHVYAIDTDSGTERWAVETGGPVRSPPAVFRDRVIVGSDDNGIYAIGIETGDVLWAHETGDRVRAPPLVDVHTRLGDAPHLVAVGSSDGVMYVFEPRSGDLIHRQEAEGPITESAVMGVWRKGWELIWGPKIRGDTTGSPTGRRPRRERSGRSYWTRRYRPRPLGRRPA